MEIHANAFGAQQAPHSEKVIENSRLDEIAMVEQLVLRGFRLQQRTLQWPQRGRALNALARQVAIYVIHVNLGLSLTDCAAVYNRDRTTAGHACRKVEDLREDRPVDQFVDAIEQAVRRWRVFATCPTAGGEVAR